LSRVEGWCDLDGVWFGAPGKKLSVLRDLQYHHLRAKSRLVQRAAAEKDMKSLGLNPVDRGTLFTYESLCARQVFAGSIRGPAWALRELRNLVADGSSVALGRSRSAEYGGAAQWRWLDSEPRAVAAAGTGSIRRITLTLVTPVIALSRENGHPEARFPLEQLALRLKLAGDALDKKVERQFARVEWQGAYLSHLRLPRQQMPALAAGSVLVIELPVAIDRAAIEAAVARPFGLRTEDGYGRVSLRMNSEDRVVSDVDDMGEDYHDYSSHEPEYDARLRFSNGDEAALPIPGRLSESIERDAGPRRAFALALLRDRVERAALALAAGDVASAANNRGGEALRAISNHLLARLARMLRTTSLDEFAHRLRRPEPSDRGSGALREAARKQLERCRIQLDERGQIRTSTLEDHLLRYAVSFQAEFKALANAVFAGKNEPWQAIFGGVNPLLAPSGGLAGSSFAESAIKLYLLGLLGGMARRKRANQTEGGTR
jgi:hypothetical protein